MRIVFDIEGQPQVSGSADGYSVGPVDQPPQWRGFRAEVLIVDCIDWDSAERRREGDAIYIHGNGDAIKRAFREALAILEANEQHAREEVDRIIARTVVWNSASPSCRPSSHIAEASAGISQGDRSND